jgi:hypothetical protein
MSIQAQLVIVAWIPIILVIFNLFPSRTAALISFVGGMLFLPQGAGFRLPLIPDYTGVVATCYGIIIGILLYDFERITNFKFHWVDLPMISWCLCPAFSSLTNGLGAYDAATAVLSNTTVWGLPYFIGRVYFNNLSGMRELALIIIKGGMIYVPLCLFEIRMSPQLHYFIYGYYAHGSGIAQAIRLGGWRPMVFMQHGLVVGIWMMTVTIVALWMWKAKALYSLWGFPFLWLLLSLVVTFVLIKSSGALLLLIIGVGILYISQWRQTRLPLLILVGSICFYLWLAVTGSINHDAIVSWMSHFFSYERVGSLQFRFDNENLLREKAFERLIFGWGGWGRSRVYQESWDGEIVDVSVTDSLWIIVFGEHGLVGLISLFSALLLPVVYFAGFSYPVKTWFSAKVAPAGALAISLALFVINCLLNAHFLPVYPTISGALAGLILSRNVSPTSSKTSSVKLPQVSPRLKRYRSRLASGNSSLRKNR